MDTFTKEEIEVVLNYLDRKLYRLEEADLKDSKCYPLLYSFRQKLNKVQRSKN